ncbi:TPA: ribulose-phosphate 3-epimerase [Candidatus Dependentiae bacterium]|nr:MAG: Ribulose-phosphate 3-epimerase [candidate division TM6 bacterium GW2011_GWE2_31_21]KKP53827.1 MAG: Ribulose-phosphate 3-epimerase [candidate division TM6 bacterium GW2011_GWF2_33_332]HBS47607.1 ribulose-phosphate 3-epimerase [Candidatus Dependentiae bacterium]HBZ73756.1 ribulose-phosphate 3-epimerase [Candidatus Dependentiae bacterium]
MEIFPSLISADLLNLEKVINSLNDKCDGFHIDVMDNHFVPNLTWGPAFIQEFVKIAKIPLDVHLMVDDPQGWIDKLKLRPIDYLIFHVEACKDNEEIIKICTKAKKIGCKIGMAINPKTKIDSFLGILNIFDQVLIMSVEPGFSGQKFDKSVMDKVQKIAELKRKNNLKLKISMDGGIGKDNIKFLSENGVDRVGVATSVFGGGDYLKNLADLYAQM